METLDVQPTYPPPKRPTRPKITLQIPETVISMTPKGVTPGASIYRGPPRFGITPSTPVSRISDPHSNPYLMHLYHNKASEFMFKQFEGFKDFTMNTAKSGLSAGEKSAFWFFNKLKLLSRKWFTHLFLCLCLCLYSLVGATIFVALEAPNENIADTNLTNLRKEMVTKIRKIFVENQSLLLDESFDVLSRIETDLENYETNYTACMKHNNNNDTKHKTWTFWNAMFYAGTIYTTIGYGHIAPKTLYGRIATIVYAIIGIPLFLILLADFGKLFTRIIKFFWAFIRRFYYTRSCRKVRRTGPVQEVMKGLNIVYDAVRRPSQIFSEEEVQEDPVTEPPLVVRKPSDVPPPLPPKPGSIARDLDNVTEPETPAPSVFEIDDEFNLPISVAVFILLVYIIIGAFVYSRWEDWNFFESFYFIFISITTIGLGDYVPDHPMFMMASILYLVFGFALTSMFINVVQVKLSDTFKKASAKLGATIGLRVSEDDGSLVPITPPPIEIVPVHKPKTETPQIVETGDTKSIEPIVNDTNDR